MVIENKMMQGMRAVLKMTRLYGSRNVDMVHSEDLSPQLGEDHLNGPVICESVPDPKP